MLLPFTVGAGKGAIGCDRFEQLGPEQGLFGTPIGLSDCPIWDWSNVPCAPMTT
jgi:hypothetical protein